MSPISMPSLSLGSFARGATQAVSLLEKWPIARRVVGALGTPVFYDLNKEYGPKRQVPEKGIGYFFKRYFSWGIAVSILAAIGSFFDKRFSSLREGEQPTLIRALISFGLRVFTFGGIGASLYSEFQKQNVWFKCGEDAFNIATGSGFLEDIEVRKNQDLIPKTIDSPLRFNDGSSGEENEDKDIRGLCNAREDDLKAIFIGPSGTGKTEAMDLIAGTHVKRNPDRYVVWNINGNKVAGRIQEYLEKQSGLANLFGSANEDIAKTYGALTQVSASKLLTSVLAAIRVEAKRAKSEGKRLIVQFDEIDKLWNLAKGDDKVMAAIAGGLSDLWECKDLDIMFASNTTLQKMLGLGDRYRTIDDIEQSPLANMWGRMRGKVISVSNPALITQSKIIATYLLKLPKKYGVAEQQLFDDEILSVISNKSPEARERDLAELIYMKLYKPLQEDEKEKRIYCYLSGRDLMIAITNKLLTNNLLEDGKIVSGRKITLNMVCEEIRKATEPFRKVLESSPGTEIQQRKEDSHEQQVVDKNIEILLSLSDEQLAAHYNDQRNQHLFERILHRGTPRANELNTRIFKLILARSQQ